MHERESGSRPSHHADPGFRNPNADALESGSLLRWQLQRMARRLPRPPEGGYSTFGIVQSAPVDSRRLDRDAGVWWLGHATVLLRVDGVTLLTDPHLMHWAAPYPFLGPRRKVPPPVGPLDLPPIDVVLVSHNHYDHLDRETVRRLAHRHPGARFAVPLGLGARVRAWGVRWVQEFDWWQSAGFGGVTVTCVPAQHWSRRTLLDHNRSLWCGWVAETEDFRFYFAGDTGYTERLADIARRLGPPDLAALPIGAYAPRWFMRPHHVDPHEAVRLHRELGARHSLAIHWGTFELTDEALDEPPRKLRDVLGRDGLSEDDFWIFRQGESRAID